MHRYLIKLELLPLFTGNYFIATASFDLQGNGSSFFQGKIVFPDTGVSNVLTKIAG